MGVLLLLFIIYAFYIYGQMKKGEIFMYDGKWWQKDEWVKVYDPYSLDTPEKNTPEQVYADFRQALLDNDMEKALGLLTDKHKKEYRESFEKEIAEKGSLVELGKKYPVEIKRNQINNTNYSCTYDYQFEQDGEVIDSSFGFIKDLDGYWKIDY